MQMMFLSNYYTHHQQALCGSLYKLTDGKFAFVSTEPFSEERKVLGWSTPEDSSFVKQYECVENKECIQELAQADVVILGSAPLELIQMRLKAQNLVFKYSERIFKNGYQPIKWLPRVIRYWRRYGRYHSLYLLAASAYVSADYGIHGAFIGKSYKWGYFPETKSYNIDELMRKKNPHKLLWCGRFVEWKHAEHAIEVARRLKKEGYAFELDMIGTGDQEEALQESVCKQGLESCVHFCGAMPSDDVRVGMENAGIYLFTSDFHEGRGAVLNEAMNSGCAVVASHAIGAVPFLMKHGENGLIYKNGDIEDLYIKVKYLLDHIEKQRELGLKAYYTISNLWNAEVAAERLMNLVKEIQEHGECDLYQEGPCSRAPMISNNWFKG